MIYGFAVCDLYSSAGDNCTDRLAATQSLGGRDGVHMAQAIVQAGRQALIIQQWIRIDSVLASKYSSSRSFVNIENRPWIRKMFMMFYLASWVYTLS